jgi:hypothetical protein
MMPFVTVAGYFEAWEPHTLTDPEAAPLLRELRRRSIKSRYRTRHALEPGSGTRLAICLPSSPTALRHS